MSADRLDDLIAHLRTALDAARAPIGSARWRVRIGVTNKENGLPFVADHPRRQIVRRRVFAHHAGGDDENLPAAQFHFFRLALFENNELQRLVQLQVRVLAVRPVRLQIVNFREHPAQPTDVNRLFLQFSRAHQQRQERQHFLRAAQRERRNQHASLALERAVNRHYEPFNFAFARKTRRRGAAAARGFHDEHVGFHVLKPGRAQKGLVVKAHISSVKQGFLFPANQDARRAERVAGVKKFQRRGRPSRARLVERRPFDFAIVFEALELGREIVHLVVRVERIFADAQFVALARHHVHRIVQHTLDDESNSARSSAREPRGSAGTPPAARRRDRDGNAKSQSRPPRLARPCRTSATLRGLRASGACRRPAKCGARPAPPAMRSRRCPRPGSGW